MKLMFSFLKNTKDFTGRKFTFSLGVFCMSLLASFNSYALIDSTEEKPVPRFASVKFENINVRYGPGKNYPIKYELNRKFLPVKITKEFDNWYMIEMPDLSDAWTHKSQLSGDRFAFVKIAGFANIYDSNNYDDTVIAKVGNGRLVHLDECLRDSAFCKVSIEDIRGYMKKDDFYGVLKKEQFN